MRRRERVARGALGLVTCEMAEEEEPLELRHFNGLGCAPLLLKIVDYPGGYLNEPRLSVGSWAWLCRTAGGAHCS